MKNWAKRDRHRYNQKRVDRGITFWRDYTLFSKREKRGVIGQKSSCNGRRSFGVKNYGGEPESKNGPDKRRIRAVCNKVFLLVKTGARVKKKEWKKVTDYFAPSHL